MKNFILLFFCSFSLFSQVLQRQSTSAQGKAIKIASGYNVSQSIAQNSPTGTYKNSNLIVQQGFQQYSNNKNVFKNIISTKVFPNPFISVLNFEFSQPISSEIQVGLFDLSGKLITSILCYSQGNMLNVDFHNIVEGNYIVVLTSRAFKYSTKVIKVNKL